MLNDLQPIKRTGRADEVTSAVLCLSPQRASSKMGVALRVDDGITVRDVCADATSWLPMAGSAFVRTNRRMVVPHPSELQIQVLREAYAAFNARDIDAALGLMTRDVAWPRAFKGGFVQGHDEVRAYWTEQWHEIDPHVDPVAFHADGDDRVLVDVHQVVRDGSGAIMADGHVGHRFTIEQGLIRMMEVCPLPGDGEGP